MSKVIPSLMRHLSKKRVEDKIVVESAKAESAFLAGSTLVGAVNNPFNYVQIRKDFDNRSEENLQIEHIFLRIYVNGGF